MKALTIKQPWASLIAHGIKDIENRTWKTNFRGKILIHASALPVNHDYISEILSTEQFSFLKQNNLLDTIKSVKLSAIIGEVDIVDCVKNHQSIWAEKSEYFGKTIEGKELYDEKPIYNWVLANAVLYDEPILNVKGKLSFWDYE